MFGRCRDLLDQVVATSTRSSDGPATSMVTERASRAKIDRRLARRVRPADDVDVLAGAGRSLGERRAVEHAAAGQLVQPGAASCR